MEMAELREIDTAAAGNGAAAAFALGQGMELFTGILAGLPDSDGQYPVGTLNQRIAARLDALTAKAVELARNTSAMEARP
jgi:hypothetical protein